MLIDELPDLGGQKRRLVVLVVTDIGHDRCTVTGIRPQPLLASIAVAGDDSISGAKNGLGGPIVLLQQDGRGIGIVALELFNVADRGTSEGIDRLVRITHDTQLSGRKFWSAGTHKFAHQHILRVISVLILVDEDVAEPTVITLSYVGKKLQQGDGRRDEVVEVERIGTTQPSLVLAIDLDKNLLHRVGSPSSEVVLVDEFVLKVGDLPQKHAWRKALGVHLEIARDHGHQTLRVGRVVDGEGTRDIEVSGLGTKNPHAGTVKGGDPHRTGPRTHEVTHPFLHLAGSLVGERDRQNLMWLGIVCREQVCDTTGQNSRFA